MPLTASGPSPQQPPTSSAPAPTQDRTSSAGRSLATWSLQIPASASQTPPAFGYTTNGRSVAVRPAASSAATSCGAEQFTPTATVRARRHGDRDGVGVRLPGAGERAAGAGERHPGRQVVLVEQAGDHLGLDDVRDRLDREQVRAGGGEHVQPLGVERDQLGARDVVVPAVLRPVVPDRPVRPHRRGDQQRARHTLGEREVACLLRPSWTDRTSRESASSASIPLATKPRRLAWYDAEVATLAPQR